MAKAAGNSYSLYLHLPRQPSTLPVLQNWFEPIGFTNDWFSGMVHSLS